MILHITKTLGIEHDEYSLVIRDPNSKEYDNTKYSFTYSYIDSEIRIIGLKPDSNKRNVKLEEVADQSTIDWIKIKIDEEKAKPEESKYKPYDIDESSIPNEVREYSLEGVMFKDMTKELFLPQR